MRCPVGAWDRERGGGIGSNGAAPTRRDAMPRWAWDRERGWGIGSNGAAPTRRDAMPVGAWTRDRNAIVPFAQRGNAYQLRASLWEPQFALKGAMHTSPGQRPGNPVRENRCVLKEHRIGRAGSISETRGYAAFLQNAGFFFRVDSQGLHPGLVCDAPLGHGIGNVVAELAPTEPLRHVGTRCPVGAWTRERGGGIGSNGAPPTRWNAMPVAGWDRAAANLSCQRLWFMSGTSV